MSHWHLIELTRKREAVRAGIDLLDRKREALVRQLVGRRGQARVLRTELTRQLSAARREVRFAVREIGRPACEAAAVAQQSPASLELREDRVLGVRLPVAKVVLADFEISYGPAGTDVHVDRAARAFAALLPPLVELASQESALRNLERALRKTVRTLNALKDLLLPELDAEIRSVAAGLEEDERDERARWGRGERRGSGGGGVR